MKKTNPLILVIEDEPMLLKSIEAKLKISGLDPLGFSRAEDALDSLQNAPRRPDLIWLDYYLKSEMNGLDFMKKIHDHTQWSRIPVIIVSNTATQAKVDEMLALGAKKYFLKAESRLGDIIDHITLLLHAGR